MRNPAAISPRRGRTTHKLIGRASIGALATTLMMVGCTPGDRTQIRSASARLPSPEKAAAQFAAMGVAAMRARDGAKAVAMAERAVASQPAAAAYRAQLAQSYLMDGRFASAADAFRDAVALAPDDGRSLLGMALALGALDRRDAARTAIDAAKGRIGDADRGLALALAGDGAAAIAMLEPVARAADATPKTRQNLALAYALAGRWDAARATAAQDVAPDALDARMAKWATLAKPQAPIDRVAAFLGIVPAAADTGMPVQLALGGPIPSTPLPAADPAPVATAAAPLIPVLRPQAEPAGTVVAMVTAPVAVPVPVSVADSVPVPQSTPDAGTLDAAPAMLVRPVAADRPVRVVSLEQAPPRRHVVPSAPMLLRTTYVVPRAATGTWVVQLGAFSSGRSIEENWDRITRTVAPVSAMRPLSSTVRKDGVLFQRLAVGGIETRAQAASLCERVRGSGGVCFVRPPADEAPVQMVARKAPVRLAAR